MADALKGKVAIVTGAGRGIGRAVALLFVQEGAMVVANDPGVSVDGSGRSASPADQVVAEITALGGRAVASYEDVGEFATGEHLVRQALDAFGRLDIVVTCQGILRDRMVFNMSDEEWDTVVRVHLKGTFNVVRHACPVMQQQRWGRIITITSEAGLWGNLGQANYGSAKAGIVGFTRAVAREMGPYAVTANAVAPRALTRMTQGVPSGGGQARATTLQDFDRWKEWTPEDVAPFVAFLASDRASYVNGQVFLVYGNNVALLAQPRLVRAISKPEGQWGVEELRQVLPQTLVKDLPNPAPAQHRQQPGTVPTTGPS